MTVTFKWDNEEKTALYFEFSPTYTWDEFYRAIDEAVETLQDIPHPVGMILALPPNVKIPSNAVSHGKRFIDGLPEQVALVVNVGTNRIIGILFNLGIKMYPNLRGKVIVCPSVDEARAAINTRLAELGEHA